MSQKKERLKTVNEIYKYSSSCNLVIATFFFRFLFKSFEKAHLDLDLGFERKFAVSFLVSKGLVSTAALILARMSTME